MADQRLVKLAKLMVNYSVSIEKGEFVTLQGSDLSLPLAKEIYREAIRQGAHVDVLLDSPGFQEIFYKEASDEQLETLSPLFEILLDKYDAMINIMGGYNTKALSNVDTAKMQKQSMARKDIMSKFFSKIGTDLKYGLTLFPTHSGAQEAGMSLEEYEDFAYGAMLLDMDNPTEEWKKISALQEKVVHYLDTKKTLHIKSKDTDLKMSIEGRKWVNCDGKLNMPDGEVYSTPIEDSVEGHIRFSYPGIFQGKEIQDIRLEFKEGKVVKATAEKGEGLLHSLLDIDEGSRRLGEIAIGTNYGIEKFTKNMLFDEKLGGTVHAALGAVPSKVTGGNNQSGIHWDMLCDMKDGGEIYADGQLFYKDGQFINEVIEG